MNQRSPLPHILVLFAAISSACAPIPGPQRAEPASAHSFAVTHHAELQRELGAGGGPNVQTLATLAQCSKTSDAARVLTDQRNKVYPAPNADAAADRLLALLAENQQLGCRAATARAEGGRSPTSRQHGEEAAKNAAERANMKEQYGE